ncbi:DNA-3-methyladenine glycosylase isoform X6 [Nasonia vitripennis]|uniref:DNA-3-methyladenine glycosylase n=1 Tax=Nasonia vitripennis TaxID=7425 RepID=A0A7M7QMI6_NASVI|nr:DNA-3-methyladenine glycosylase isoform X6 [Nasonia vitripennis]
MIRINRSLLNYQLKKNTIYSLALKNRAEYYSSLKEKDLHTIMEESKSRVIIHNDEEDKRKINIEIVPPPTSKKPRAVVDLKLMKEELKQLEDPPMTPWEKKISSNRLPYSFYDVPCKTLAKSILGKVLVRKLENGTILKGRIVETESYLGIEDGASHTFKGKVTPRNTPMYMKPGTIYVYFTYGMYHCFNISSQESGKFVLIKNIEPLVGLDYMELLRNTQKSVNREGNEMTRNIKKFKSHELCNGPSEICKTFVIEKDEFDGKNICNNNYLWIEENSS